MNNKIDEGNRSASEKFQATSWSLVLRAQEGVGDVALDALNTLCTVYWYPLYAYIRRVGNQPEEAEDLTQGYFQSLLDRNYLASACREKGKLRTFLLSDLNLFLSNERRRANAAKRGGGKIFVPIDRQWAEEYFTHELVDDVSPAEMFDRRWAVALLRRVLGVVRKQYADRGRGELFDALKSFILGNAGSESYFDVAKEIGRDENYVKQNVHRLRKVYRQALAQEVSQTVGSVEEVEGEIRHLIASLC